MDFEQTFQEIVVARAAQIKKKLADLSGLVGQAHEICDRLDIFNQVRGLPFVTSSDDVRVTVKKPDDHLTITVLPEHKFEITFSETTRKPVTCGDAEMRKVVVDWLVPFKKR